MFLAEIQNQMLKLIKDRRNKKNVFWYSFSSGDVFNRVGNDFLGSEKIIVLLHYKKTESSNAFAKD